MTLWDSVECTAWRWALHASHVTYSHWRTWEHPDQSTWTSCKFQCVTMVYLTGESQIQVKAEDPSCLLLCCCLPAVDPATTWTSHKYICSKWKPEALSLRKCRTIIQRCLSYVLMTVCVTTLTNDCSLMSKWWHPYPPPATRTGLLVAFQANKNYVCGIKNENCNWLLDGCQILTSSQDDLILMQSDECGPGKSLWLWSNNRQGSVTTRDIQTDFKHAFQCRAEDSCLWT